MTWNVLANPLSHFLILLCTTSFLGFLQCSIFSLTLEPLHLPRMLSPSFPDVPPLNLNGESHYKG